MTAKTVRSINIDANLCNGCEICVYFCPVDILVLGEESNANGYRVVRVTDLGRCAGCRLCEYNCPDLAISVED